MGSINRVILIGNLGADPELKFLPSGKAVSTLRMATNETFTGKDGKAKTVTEWHRCTVWGPLAETCSKYLTKGRQVYVEGKLQTRSWEKDNIKRYTTEVVVTKVVFLGAGQKMEASTSEGGEPVPEGLGDDSPQEQPAI